MELYGYIFIISLLFSFFIVHIALKNKIIFHIIYTIFDFLYYGLNKDTYKSMRRNEIAMQKLKIILLFSFFICSLFSSCGLNEVDLEEINRSCIYVEEIDDNSSRLSSDCEEVTVNITMPNYVDLYLRASKAENFQGYLAEALQSGDYLTLQFTETVPVITKDGNRIIQSDDAVMNLLEQELIRAMNALEEDTP